MTTTQSKAGDGETRIHNLSPGRSDDETTYMKWAAIAALTILGTDTARSQTILPSDPALLAVNVKLQLRPSYQKCIDASMAATPALLDCSSKEFAYQDKRLNENYKKLMARLIGEARVHLRSEERAWLFEKNALCSTGEEPGQGGLVVSATCEVTETAKRANAMALRTK